MRFSGSSPSPREVDAAPAHCSASGIAPGVRALLIHPDGQPDSAATGVPDDTGPRVAEQPRALALARRGDAAAFAELRVRRGLHHPLDFVRAEVRWVALVLHELRIGASAA